MNAELKTEGKIEGFGDVNRLLEHRQTFVSIKMKQLVESFSAE